LKKRNTQFPPDATAVDEPAGIDGDVAPSPESTEDPVPASDPRIEPPAVSESAPPAAVDPTVPTAAAAPELPVASALPPVAPLLPTAAVAVPLESRIQRLETELAQLRTAQARDSRFAVAQPADATPPAAAPDPAAAVVRRPGRFWTDLGSRLTAPSAPAAAPPRAAGLSSLVPPAVRRSWTLWEAITELRAMYWMFFDPRYRLSWAARLAPPVILVLIVTSLYRWMTPATALPYIGMVIDKIVDLVLAYILFKLLSNEARRYRETAPDLPPSLRL